MTWHRLKGSIGSSRTRGEECNHRGITRRGKRIWATYRLVGKGREAALVNYVWECTHGEERRDYIIACLRSNVNSDQWNGSRSSSIGLSIGFVRDLYAKPPSVNRVWRSRIADQWEMHRADLGWWLYWLFMSIGLAPLGELVVKRGMRERLPFEYFIFF